MSVVAPNPLGEERVGEREEEEEGNLSSVIKSFRELRRCHYAFLLAPTYKGAPSLKTLKSTKERGGEAT